eukprot:sb/3468751/
MGLANLSLEPTETSKQPIRTRYLGKLSANQGPVFPDLVGKALNAGTWDNAGPPVCHCASGAWGYRHAQESQVKSFETHFTCSGDKVGFFEVVTPLEEADFPSILSRSGNVSPDCRLHANISLEPTETSKQPIRTRYLGHVTSYQPIRDQYFLIWSVPDLETCQSLPGNIPMICNHPSSDMAGVGPGTTLGLQCVTVRPGPGATGTPRNLRSSRLKRTLHAASRGAAPVESSLDRGGHFDLISNAHISGS